MPSKNQQADKRKPQCLEKTLGLEGSQPLTKGETDWLNAVEGERDYDLGMQRKFRRMLYFRQQNRQTLQ